MSNAKSWTENLSLFPRVASVSYASPPQQSYPYNRTQCFYVSNVPYGMMAVQFNYTLAYSYGKGWLVKAA